MGGDVGRFKQRGVRFYERKQSSASLHSAPPLERRQTENESPLYKEGGTAERRDG